MQDRSTTPPETRKPWVRPKLRRIAGGSAEFGTGIGGDGSGVVPS
jgi:hypothetical protein